MLRPVVAPQMETGLQLALLSSEEPGNHVAQARQGLERDQLSQRETGPCRERKGSRGERRGHREREGPCGETGPHGERKGPGGERWGHTERDEVTWREKGARWGTPR